MNTTNCPTGRFTDQIYNYYAAFDTCDSDINALIGTMSVIVIIRFLLFLEIVRIWRKARRSDVARQKARGFSTLTIQRRLPIVPMLHFLSCIILSALYALVFTNTVTARNGTTHLMMVLWVTPFLSIEALALRKLVHLGKRIIPWNGKMQGEDVSKFDSRLRKLMVGMIALFFLGWISMIIGCFTEPLIFGRISIASFFIHQVLFFSSLVYQYQRCISCISVTMIEQRKSMSSLAQAKRRLRFQQAIMSICGFSTTATLAYYAISLAAPFWAMEIAFAIELMSYGLIAISFAGMGKTANGPQMTPPATDRPNEGNTSRESIRHSATNREAVGTNGVGDIHRRKDDSAAITVVTVCDSQEKGSHECKRD